MRCWAVLATTLAVVLLPASGAAAQGSDVHIDPNSPTGQEYDIPLERARRQSSSNPSAAAQPSRSSSSELFGEGIDAPSDGGPSSSGDSSGSGGAAPSSPSKKQHPSRERSRMKAPIPPAAVQAALREPGAPDGGSGSALLIGGLAALVLMIGVAAGVALRRRGN